MDEIICSFSQINISPAKHTEQDVKLHLVNIRYFSVSNNGTISTTKLSSIKKYIRYLCLQKTNTIVTTKQANSASLAIISGLS